MQAASYEVNRARVECAQGKPTPVCGHLYRRTMQICQENAMSRNEIPYRTHLYDLGNI